MSRPASKPETVNETESTEGPQSQSVRQLPTIPLKDMVVFPNLVVPLMVGRPRSIAAVQAAVSGDNVVFLVTQKDPDVEEVSADDMYRMGCLCRVLQTLKLPDGSLKVVGEVFERARAIEFKQEAELLVTSCTSVACHHEPSEDDDAFATLLVDKFHQYVEMNPMVPDKIAGIVNGQQDLARLSDLVVAHMSVRIPDKQEVLGCLDVRQRVEKAVTLLNRELELLDAQTRIQERLRGRIQKTQKEYYLREQLRAIEDELGAGDIDRERCDELEARIGESGMPPDVAEVALKELDRLRRTPPMTPQSAVMESYVETLVDLPWSTVTEDNLNLDHAGEILDEDHYGLEEPKRRIIEYLAVRKLTARPQGQILCLVGPPGVGKTSLARSVARAMGRNFIRKSLGGVRDEAEIRGHRRTYVGAMPGRIVQSLIKAGSRNPVFLLDEIDKLSRDYHGDPGSALLEVLDPTENSHFSDHYLEVEFDLSEVFFITTANLEAGIPHVLRDRMEVIRLAGYSRQEKIQIARKYIVREEMKDHGLTTKNVTLTASGLKTVIEEYTRESGVRELKRQIATLMRRVATEVAKGGKRKKKSLTATEVRKLLGPPRYLEPPIDSKRGVGVATGLAWTEMGGRLMSVEAIRFRGKQNLLLTGSLGDVMQESARAAMSYVRSNAERLGIDPREFARNDVHVHVPEGAVPKDGPSAGVTVATALASCFSGRAVDRKVAMTGEISLRGRVLAVGGIREKVLAAHREGLRRVILPEANAHDLEKLPEEVRKVMTFIPVKTLDEVFDTVLDPSKKK